MVELKQALRYRTAHQGFQSLKTRPLCTVTAADVCRTLKGVDMDATRSTTYRLLLMDVSFEQSSFRIGNLVDEGIAQCQAATRYLHDLASPGVLREVPFGKEKLFIPSTTDWR